MYAVSLRHADVVRYRKCSEIDFLMVCTAQKPWRNSSSSSMILKLGVPNTRGIETKLRFSTISPLERAARDYGRFLNVRENNNNYGSRLPFSTT